MVQFDDGPMCFRSSLSTVIYRASLKTEALVTVQNSDQSAPFGDHMIISTLTDLGQMCIPSKDMFLRNTNRSWQVLISRWKKQGEQESHGNEK